MKKTVQKRFVCFLLSLLLLLPPLGGLSVDRVFALGANSSETAQSQQAEADIQTSSVPKAEEEPDAAVAEEPEKESVEGAEGESTETAGAEPGPAAEEERVEQPAPTVVNNGRYTKATPNYENNTIEFVVKADGYDYCYAVGSFNNWGQSVGDQRFRLNWVQENPNDSGSWVMKGAVPIEKAIPSGESYQYKFVLIKKADEEKDQSKWEWINANGWKGGNSYLPWEPPAPPAPEEKITLSIKSSDNVVTPDRSVELLSVKKDEYDQLIEIPGTWKIHPAVEGASVVDNRLVVTDAVADGEKLHVYADVPGEKSEEKIITVSKTKAEGTLTHYFRRDQNYQGWGFWSFEEGAEGTAIEFQEQANDLGVAAYLTRKNVIIRKNVNGNEWGEQTASYQIPVGEQNAYIIEGEERVYTSLKDAVLACNPQISAAVMDSADQITAYLTESPKPGVSFQLLVDGVVQPNAVGTVKDRVVTFQTKGVSIDPTKLIEVQGIHQFTTPKQVLLRNVLNGYVYQGRDLGAVYTTNERVQCKLWAPTACKVEVVLYDTIEQEKEAPTTVKEMVLDPATGVYSADLTWAEAYKKYYLYRLSFAERNGDHGIGTRVTYAVDPYAEAVGLNGTKGYLLDIEKDESTFPKDFAQHQRPEFLNPEDAIIYEMHVRDFTIDPNWGGNPAYAGKYLGIVQPNTRYTKDNVTVTTGLDHLKELGITHVHLLPTYDIASVNEAVSSERNWGYDPLNYNVPEGSYSTAPADPAARIREYREMVQGLHKAGIRVVLDQVYNHMASVDNMNNIVPGYYFRSWEDGKLSNGSGCGNEMASERPMVRKFIVDSNCHWVEDYKVDGLRFDLMALLDKETMAQVKKEVQNIESSVIFYGEPWLADKTPLPEWAQTKKNHGISAFNDTFRNALRGDNSPSQGFVNGFRGEQSNTVQEGIKGQPGTVSDPEYTINYVEAHDNYAIWDQIIKNEGLDQDGYRPSDILNTNAMESWKVRKAVLANGFVLTSQGVPFFQGGSEILRTKDGDHNSYKSSDEVNDIDWADKAEFKEVFDYYKGLIQLRKEHPAFRLTTNQEIAAKQNVYRLMDDNNLILQHLKKNANGDKWQNILVIYNASINSKTVTWLPHSESGKWNVVADENGVYVDKPESQLKTIPQSTDPHNNVKFQIPSSSIMILYDTTEAAPVEPDLQWDYLFADQSVDYMEPMEPAADDAVKVRFRAAAGEVTDAILHFYEEQNAAAGDQQVVMHKITAPEFYTKKGYDSSKIEFWEGTLPASSSTRYYNFEVINKKGAAQKTAWISGGQGENKRGVSNQAPRMNPADPHSGIDYGFSVVPAYKTPAWSKEAVFYQIMVDRFRDGDANNNRVKLDEAQMGNPSEISKWGEPVTNGTETDLIWNNQFYGGDLIGVQEAIPYLKNVLGIDSVYLMPIFQSGSDHKYDTDDYHFVDKNFGGNPALVDLSADLHQEGMHLVLDGVFNHTSTQTEWFKDKNIWDSFYFVGHYLDNGTPPNPIDFYPWHGYTNLAKLNYSSQKVKDAIYQSKDAVATSYLQAPYHVDGWRLDAAEDVNTEPRDHDNQKDPNKDKTTQTNEQQKAENLKIWTEFRTAVEGVKPEAYILGEYWGNENQWFNGRAWDGKMNYGGFLLPFVENYSGNSWLGDQSLDNKGNSSVAGIGAYTRDHFKKLPYQAVLNSTNSISTHDKPRFLNREYAGKDNEAMMELAATLQLTYPGIPMIYYGDEIGMRGEKSGADPYNRATFSWQTADWNKEMLKDHRTLIAARKANKNAFVYGAFEEIASDKGGKYIAYARYGNNNPALVILNNQGAAGEQWVTLDRLERYGLADGDVLVDVMTDQTVVVKNGRVEVPSRNMSASVYVKQQNAPQLQELGSIGLRELSDKRTKLPEVQNVTYAVDGQNVTVQWNHYDEAGAKEISARVYGSDGKMLMEKGVSLNETQVMLALPQDASDYTIEVKACANRKLKNDIVNDIYADSAFVQAVLASDGTDASGTSLVGYSVSAKNGILMNFYLELPEAVRNDPGAYMLITAEDGTETKVMVSEVTDEPHTVNEKQCYRFSYGVAAKQMTDQIIVQMFVTGKDGRMISGAPAAYTVQEYAKTVLEDTAGIYGSESKAVILAMLNYGAAAQKEFGYKTDDLANAILTAEQQAQADQVTAEEFAPYGSAVVGRLEGVSYIGSSLLLESETAIRHYFKLEDAAAAEQYQFMVSVGEGQQAALKPVLSDKLPNGANAYVEITGISAKDLGVFSDVKVMAKADPQKDIRIHYCALSYAKTVLEQSDSQTLQNLAKQLYWYDQKAYAYASKIAEQIKK